MPEATITIKNAGPSKKYPDKYGWILSEEGGKDGEFWNVTLAQARQAKEHIGSRCKVTHHTNNKGYPVVDSVSYENADPPKVNGGINGPGRGLFQKLCVEHWDRPIPDVWRRFQMAGEVYDNGGPIDFVDNIEDSF